MRHWIEESFADEERASRIVLNWIVAVGMTSWVIAVGAIVFMR